MEILAYIGFGFFAFLTAVCIGVFVKAKRRFIQPPGFAMMGIFIGAIADTFIASYLRDHANLALAAAIYGICLILGFVIGARK